jgi:hypothetical protein
MSSFQQTHHCPDYCPVPPADHRTRRRPVMSARNARDDLPEEHRDIGDAKSADKVAVMNSSIKGASPWPVIGSPCHVDASRPR